MFVLFQLVVLAQGVQRFPLRTYSTSDGVSQSSVYHILRDRDGYIWAGTGDGLNQLSPHAVKVFKRDLFDSESLSANAIRGLVEDQEGNIWIGTDQGLNVYDRQAAKVRRHFRGEPLLSSETCVPIGIFEHSLIALQQGVGVFAIDLATGRIKESYPLETLLRSDQRCLFLHTNQVWLPALDGRLFKLDLNTGMYTQGEVPWPNSANVSQIGPFVGQEVFVAANNRLYAYNIHTGRWHLRYEVSNQILSFGIVSGNEVWINSWSEGLIRINLSGKLLEPVVKTLNVYEQQSLDLGTINCIKQTKDEVVWLGLEGLGLVSIVPKARFNWISAHDPYFPGINQAFSTSLAPMDAQNILLATYPSGLFQLDFKHNVAHPISHPTQIKTTIESMVYWNSDSLFVGTDTEVWLLTDRQEYKFLQAQRIGQFNVQHLQKIGDLLIIAGASGLYLVEPRVQNAVEQLMVGSFRFTVPSEVGFLALSSTEILAFNSAAELVKRGGEDAIAYGIKSLHYSTQSGIWAASENGLLQLDNARFDVLRSYTTKEGLLDNLVYGVLEHAGTLWGSGNRGLFSLDLQSGAIQTFTKFDGLQANEFNSNCFAASHDGRLMFGGIAGLTVFHPNDFVPRAASGGLVLKRIWLNDEPCDERVLEQKLKSTERNFNFEWDLLEWERPEGSTLKCRLEGLDSAWTDLQNRRSIRYTALPPGSYKLWAKSGNADGNWSEPKLFASFSIAPPFYQSWWFISLGIMLVLASFGAVIYFTATRRYRNKLAKLERQKEMDQLRKRISRDIHDDVGADLSKIMMLSQRLEKATNADDLTRLNALAKHALDGLSEVVWTVNSDYDRLPDFVAWLRVFSHNFFDGSGVELEFNATVPMPDFLLDPDLRRNLLMIFKEGANNVVKHARATAVQIDVLCTAAGVLQLQITDNGRGFSTVDAFAGNGLRNMKQRAEHAGIEWQMRAAPAAGTTIHLTVDLAKKLLRKRDLL